MPICITDYKPEIIKLIEKYDIDTEEIIKYSFGFDPANKEDSKFGEALYWNKNYVAYAGHLFTPIEDSINDIDKINMIHDAMTGSISFLDCFVVDFERLLDVFICFLIEYKVFEFNTIEDIISVEDLPANADKYGLSEITFAQFERQGFVVDDKYYLYNIFMDTSIMSPHSTVPRIIEIIHNKHISDLSIWMRCDNSLCVNNYRKVCTAGVGFEKFRGVNFCTTDIENHIINSKEIIVHFDPKTMNKLLLIIKPESNNGENYYHISVEQLWNPDIIPDNDTVMITNYIHGCYYPMRKSFDHIDFSVNQYLIEAYSLKHRDSLQATGTPIEKYGDNHYKVWCIKGNNLDMDFWSQLVFYSLDDPFRPLFAEILGGVIERT